MVAWGARDDSAHAAHEAADGAEGVAYEAAVQIELDKLPAGASEAEMYAMIRRAKVDE